MLKDVGGVGQRGKVIDVSDGYALNSLIPRGEAVQATAHKLAEHARHEKIETDKRDAEHSALKGAVQRLNNAEIVISSRATEKGGLFKAVSAADIAKAVAEQKGTRLQVSAVQLSTPIKTTGDHTITIKAADAAAHIKLVIRRI
jgi:large subunit ribosomal protein L9